jgi:hypothetical protein
MFQGEISNSARFKAVRFSYWGFYCLRCSFTSFTHSYRLASQLTATLCRQRLAAHMVLWRALSGVPAFWPVQRFSSARAAEMRMSCSGDSLGNRGANRLEREGLAPRPPALKFLATVAQTILVFPEITFHATNMAGGSTMNDTKDKEQKQNPEPHKTTDRKTTKQIPPDRDPGNQSKNPGQGNSSR